MAAFQMEELQLEIWPRAETTAAETAANVQQQQNWANLQQQQGYTAFIAIVNCRNEYGHMRHAAADFAPCRVAAHSLGKASGQ